MPLLFVFFPLIASNWEMGSFFSSSPPTVAEFFLRSFKGSKLEFLFASWVVICSRIKRYRRKIAAGSEKSIEFASSDSSDARKAYFSSLSSSLLGFERTLVWSKNIESRKPFGTLIWSPVAVLVKFKNGCRAHDRLKSLTKSGFSLCFAYALKGTISLLDI